LIGDEAIVLVSMGSLDVGIRVSERNAAMDVIDIFPDVGYKMAIRDRELLTVPFSTTSQIYPLCSVLEKPH
jgi:hypothetical protein